MLSLYNPAQGVETAVKNFKNLLGSKIESLFKPNEMFLKASAVDSHDVRQGRTTAFDFYKYRLNIITSHENPKSVNFLRDGTSSCPPPDSNSPSTFFRTINTRDGRPISGDPSGQCYHEQRTEKNERTSETIAKYRLRPGTPVPSNKRPRQEQDDDVSESEPDRWESNPDASHTSGEDTGPRHRSRSHSRGRERYKNKNSSRRDPSQEQPRRSTRLAQSITNPVIRFIEKTIAKAIDNRDSTVYTKRPRDPSRSPGRPPSSNQRQPRATRECRPPPDACSALSQGAKCYNPMCQKNHGTFLTTTPEGASARPCDFEERGQPCPYIWMPAGCFFAHSVASVKNVKAA